MSKANRESIFNCDAQEAAGQPSNLRGGADILVRHNSQGTDNVTKRASHETIVGVVFDPCTGTLSCEGGMNGRYELPLVGPQLFLVPSRVAHAIRWNTNPDALLLH